MRGTLLVAGTTSDAGKSVLVAGLCRWLARQGVRVAPFKAQNMSLNSFVTRDGAEIGRAQAMQAAAAGIEPRADMNPVLLKPGSDRRSQVVVLGQPEAEADAVGYRAHAPRLRQVALDSLARAAARSYDVVICEGAGSPAEINLREADIANMGLARAAGLPVHRDRRHRPRRRLRRLYGTVALLSPETRRSSSGFVVNKFRGAAELLDRGLVHAPRAHRPPRLRRPALAGRPLAGRRGLPGTRRRSIPRPARTTVDHRPGLLRVAVVRLPRISNFTDVDALAAEPGVLVRFVTDPAELADADLVVLPGSRATVADLAWLRDRGLAAAVPERRAGRPVLGICGGYQMLAGQIDDEVESGGGRSTGSGCFRSGSGSAREKTLGRPRGRAGRTGRPGTRSITASAEITDRPPTSRSSTAAARRDVGHHWHGALENDGFRRAFLHRGGRAGRAGLRPGAGHRLRPAARGRLDVLGDLVGSTSTRPR